MLGRFTAIAERLKKSWGWTTVGAVVIVALIFAFWPRPVLVDTAEVVSGPMQVFVTDDGETRIHDIFRISAPLAGRVLRIDSHVGDEVVAGETVVATLQQTDPAFLDVRSQSEREAAVRAAEAAVSLAEAEVERARAEMDFAHADLERARGLELGETISPRSLQRAEVDVQTKKAALEEAQSMLSVRRYELETARAALILPGGEEGSVDAPCCIQLNSPTNGKVLQILHKSEGVVAAGTPLLEVGDPSDLEIVVDLLSSDAVNVVEGARVMIDEWGGSHTLNGR
ncbi:MAG: efflux RND transporter periplasmic adaptor subunit, partial [Sphingomonadales bacterium]|nr:efflux RND transporter periplasmic adaptor subunit [Sphingomonadales bacterium]